MECFYFFGGEGGISECSALSRLACAHCHVSENSPLDCFLPKACGFLLPCSNLLLSSRKTKTAPKGRFCFGGEGGIRTLERFVAVTRFPIVRARPATRLLQTIYFNVILRYQNIIYAL